MEHNNTTKLQSDSSKNTSKNEDKNKIEQKPLTSDFNPMEFDLSVTEADTTLLDTLLSNKKILPRNGVSIKGAVTLMGDGALAEVTIYNIVQKYKKDGYIKEGIKSGKAKTYYLSEKGVKLYSHLFGVPQAVKEALTKSMKDTNSCFDEYDEVDYEAIVSEVLGRK